MKLSPDRSTVVAQARRYRVETVPEGIVLIDTTTGEMRQSAYPTGFSGRLDWIGNGHLWTSRLVPDLREFEVAVVRKDQTDEVAASLKWTDGEVSTTGDTSLLEGVPEYHITPMITFGNQRQRSIHAMRMRLNAEPRTYRFPWFTNENYDMGYQGLVDIAPHPFRDEALISIQRAGHFAVVDPANGQRLRVIELANRHGNASIHFDPDGSVWTDDYDTLIHLDLREERVISSARLQGEVPSEHSPTGMMRSWIGDIWPDHESGLIWIPRPYSGDVLAVRKTDLGIERSIETGGAPITAFAVNGHLITREWRVSDINIRAL